MARIFSIQFNFNEALHNALISVHETPYHTEYKISMMDDDIMSLLPGNKVISTSLSQFSFPNTPSHTYSELMKIIIREITAHIHTLQH
jgi:hypothetical protein